MTARRTLSPLLAIAILASAGFVSTYGQQPEPVEPAVPYEEPVDACGATGCGSVEWTARVPVVIKENRTSSANLLRLNAGDRVTASTGVMVTTRPGVVRFRRADTLAAGDQRIEVSAGDLLYLLTYHGEGLTSAWFRGRLYRDLDGAKAFFNALCETDRNRCSGDIREQPDTEWWVRVADANGRVGWTQHAIRFDHGTAKTKGAFMTLRPDVMKRLDHAFPGWELAPASANATQGMRSTQPNFLPNSIEGDFDDNGRKDSAVLIHSGPLNDPAAQLVAFLDTGAGLIMHRVTGPIGLSALRELSIAPRGSEGYDLNMNRAFKYLADAIRLYSGEGASSTWIYRNRVFVGIWSSD